MRGEPAATPAARATGASAADRLAMSRCDRELRCDNIGEGRKYASVAQCHDHVRADWKDDLDSRRCENGIDDRQLSECLSEIRGEDCNNAFDTLSRLTECSRAQICEQEAATDAR
jgi:hypothetical protein